MTRSLFSRSFTVGLCSLALVVSAAQAATTEATKFNPDINNPLTISIRHSMEQRLSRLVKFYEPGVVGLANDGRVAKVGDYSQIKLATRQIIEKLIDAENDDRRQFLAAVTQGNGREANKESDLDEARAAWLVRWREHMKSGWMIQDDAGAWAKKP